MHWQVLVYGLISVRICLICEFITCASLRLSPLHATILTSIIIVIIITNVIVIRQHHHLLIVFRLVGCRGYCHSYSLDIDECHLRNGHGPCQDTCHNLWSGYRCSCDNLPGTHLSPDNHTCVDAGECSLNNGGCSHTCLSSLGRIFCLCPPGYRMTGNDKTCEGS